MVRVRAFFLSAVNEFSPKEQGQLSYWSFQLSLEGDWRGSPRYSRASEEMGLLSTS